MKIKETIYRSVLRPFNSLFCLLALLVLFLATGCEQHSAGTEPDGTPVDISLNIFLGLQANSDAGTAQERKVTSLRVYAFYANGYLDKMEYVENSSGLAGDPYVMDDMTVLSGEKTFCLVANEPSRLSTSLSNIKNIWDLRAMTLEDNDLIFTSPDVALLPMTSITSAVTITAGQTETVNLSLTRAVAKVELKFIKETTNLDVVKLVSVQVWNTPDKSRLMEYDASNVFSLVDRPTQNYASALLGSAPTDTLTTEPIYLLEHHTGAGDPTSLNSTVLIVALNIEGSHMVYTIPLRVPSGSQLHYDVLRNNYYRLHVTVGDGALQIDYNVLDWIEDDSWDEELGEE